jgi:hypothetical protein
MVVLSVFVAAPYAMAGDQQVAPVEGVKTVVETTTNAAGTVAEKPANAAGTIVEPPANAVGTVVAETGNAVETTVSTTVKTVTGQNNEPSANAANQQKVETAAKQAKGTAKQNFVPSNKKKTKK